MKACRFTIRYEDLTINQGHISKGLFINYAGPGKKGEGVVVALFFLLLLTRPARVIE